MKFWDVISVAIAQVMANKLRSFFTLLGIIVSVTFLVAVVAIIQGMNAYVRDNLANALIGSNAFQVRRSPISLGLVDDEQLRLMARRPRISAREAEAVRTALPEALAIALTSGFPTPQADIVWGDRTLGDVLVYGVTAPYQVVQDYRFSEGRGLSDLDVRDRRPVVIVGADIAEKLFAGVSPVGHDIRIRGERFTIEGVVAKKGQVLGQSFDGFVMMPITVFEAIYGRRATNTISVKMREAKDVEPAMVRAEEAMRVARHLRPTQTNNFSVETADALIDFWKKLTAVLFSVIPAVVAIGVVVGGIVIMNIMLMAVNERTREIGIRKAVGATARDIRGQFLVESIVLATIGGALGVASGWGLAALIAYVSPLPASITWWSVVLALALGAGVGVLFGVYPASRAARLDPITALRAE
ncbi:MAG: ABC transporter permease [Gemmatimonadota bacterium]|nr:ABC transporter permease [Gemmatimonadota bacterium]